MASKKAPYFSDDELLAELKKLGYDNVSSEVFKMMKNDLSIMVERDNISSSRFRNSSSVRYSSDLKLLKSQIVGERTKSNDYESRTHDSIKEDLYSKYKSRFNCFGLNIETRTHGDQKSLVNYQGKSVDYLKQQMIECNEDKGFKTSDPFNSVPKDKIFPKYKQIYDNSEVVVPQADSRNLSKSISSTDKSYQNKNTTQLESKDKKSVSKADGVDYIHCVSTSSVSKINKDYNNSLKEDTEGNCYKSDITGSTDKEIISATEGNSDFYKREGYKIESKMHKVDLMTNKTKASIEYPSSNSTSKNHPSTSLNDHVSPENKNSGANHKDNSVNKKLGTKDSEKSCSNSASKSHLKSPSKHGKYLQKNRIDNIKNHTQSKKIDVDSTLTSSGSVISSKTHEIKKDQSLQKEARTDRNSNSVLSVRNRKVSPKLPSAAVTRLQVQNNSTVSIDSSNDTENLDSKFSSGLSINSSSGAENQSLLKDARTDRNSNSVLSVRNRKVSPKLPSAAVTRLQVQNNSTVSIDSSNNTENLDSKFSSGLSINSSSGAENQSLQKDARTDRNSNSVRNRKVSPKLPSVAVTRLQVQNNSTVSIDSSNDAENLDSKFSSGLSINSSSGAENHKNKFLNSSSFDSSSPERENTFPKYKFSAMGRRPSESSGRDHLTSVPSFDSSCAPADPLEKYRQRFKLSGYSTEADLLRDSPIKLKRKVLRHRNGEPIVTEELLNVPSIFTSSYPSTDCFLDSRKSFSSDDLSQRTSIIPVTQSSFSTPRSIHVRIANQRKKKSDPVAMYNYYKKFWNNFKPPGEKSHDRLRWAVRDRMLDYNL